MKNLFKKIILWLLHREAAWILKRHKPTIIAVAGSVGKTTTKDALYTVLRPKLHIRKNQKSFNSEIGVPLTILGLPNGWNNPFKWILNVFRGGLKALFQRKYPTHLILEVGVEQPGDMDVLTRWLTPDIVVLTSLPQTPVHIEFFEDEEAYWEEEREIVYACKEGGTIILNADDEEVMKTKVPEGCKTITFGLSERADHRITSIEQEYQEDVLIGQKMKLKAGGEEFEYLFEGILGEQSLLPYAVASAAQQALNLDEKAIDVSRYVPTPGRMRILPGKNKIILIDDSYNSSPIALKKGLEALKNVRSKRKIVILGDMLELGSLSVKTHRELGAEVFEFGFDHLITVGVRGAHFAEGAHEAGMSLEDIASFPSSDHEDLLDYVDHYLESGDVVYIKGSQGVRMEKLVGHLLLPEMDPTEVLSRHDSVWLKR